MHNTEHLLKLANEYYQHCSQCLDKIATIKELPNGKWQVQSHKGKNLGIRDTKEEAVERLRQVEFYKHHDKSKADDHEAVIDLTDIDDFSYSAVMRKMRQQAPKERVKVFLKMFKDQFDRAVKNKLQRPERVALQNSLTKFNKLHKIKISKKLVKNAAVSELGDPVQVGQYLANIVRFILNRLEPDKRAKALTSLRNKFYYLNADEMASKTSPPSAGIGQSITFVKHVLFNQHPQYIREVLNNLARNLY